MQSGPHRGNTCGRAPVDPSRYGRYCRYHYKNLSTPLALSSASSPSLDLFFGRVERAAEATVQQREGRTKKEEAEEEKGRAEDGRAEPERQMGSILVECVICMRTTRLDQIVACVPCGHAGICRLCAMNVLHDTCPICDVRLEQPMLLYFCVRPAEEDSRSPSPRPTAASFSSAATVDFSSPAAPSFAPVRNKPRSFVPFRRPHSFAPRLSSAPPRRLSSAVVSPPPSTAASPPSSPERLLAEKEDDDECEPLLSSKKKRKRRRAGKNKQYLRSISDGDIRGEREEKVDEEEERSTKFKRFVRRLCFPSSPPPS